MSLPDSQKDNKATLEDAIMQEVFYTYVIIAFVLALLALCAKSIVWFLQAIDFIDCWIHDWRDLRD